MNERVILELGDDFALEQVNETLIPKISSISQLDSLMKTIEYGFYSHEKEENVTSSINSRMSKEYHLQAPETTIQKKVGLCWDTVLVAKYYLNKLGYQTKMFFMTTKDMSHTHTFIVYKEIQGNNKNVRWHWYEWSWGPFINQDYNCETWEELVKTFISFKYSQECNGPIALYSCNSYPKIGCSPDAFLDQMKNKARLIGICDAVAGEFNPTPVTDKRNVKQVPPVQSTIAKEDYMERDVNGNVTVVRETVDMVYNRLNKIYIFSLMQKYVDDTLGEKQLEHILRHYIANCLQHQWWVRKFTEEIAERYFTQDSKSRFLNQEYLQVIGDLIHHDFDKLHRDLTVAAYAIRVYNQHWEEGMDEVHKLLINEDGKAAINEAWANHVRTQVHHPEHWDKSYNTFEKDLPDDQRDANPIHAESMPRRYLIQMAGDWMAASLLRHKTAQGWYKKTVGKRFVLTDKQCELLTSFLADEAEIVKMYAGDNPFATESFGVDTDVVPADIHGIKRVEGDIAVYSVDPVTGEKKQIGTTNNVQDLTKKGAFKPSPEFDPEETIATEALGGAKKSKKQQIIEYVTACMDLIDPTKDNSRRFADFVGPMSDKEFAQYIKNLKERKCHIDIVAPNMKKHLQLNDVFAAAHKIGCKLFDKVWFYDLTTGKEFLSTEEFPIFRVSVRRQEQMLDEKLSVPDKASKIDALTGQVTGDDKAGGFSMPEIQIMYSKGFKNVLKEFVKVRGGDVHAFGEFERQLEETGEGSMDQIRVNSRARSGAVLSTWLEAIHLDNNI